MTRTAVHFSTKTLSAITLVLLLQLFIIIQPVNADNSDLASNSSQQKLTQLANASGVEKARLLKKMSEELTTAQPLKSAKYAREALALLEKYSQAELSSDIYFSLLNAVSELNDRQQTKQVIDEAIIHAKTHALFDNLASFYNELARFYWVQSNYELALNALNNALPAPQKRIINTD